MKRWLMMIFLTALTVGTAQAQGVPAPTGEREQAVEPDLDRRAVDLPEIRARSVEAGLYAGVLNLDNFGSRPVYGLRLGYHVTEDFVLEANFARSTVSDESYRRFGLPLFDDEDEDFEYAQFFLLYNALPGEVFAGRRHAYRSGLYLGLGAGRMMLPDDDRVSVNVGVGVRLVPNRWLTLRADARGYMYRTDILGESEMTYNLEFTAGLGLYF